MSTVIDTYSNSWNKLKISKQNGVLHMPILNKHNIQAVFFAETRQVSQALWWTHGAEVNDFRRYSTIWSHITATGTVIRVTLTKCVPLTWAPGTITPSFISMASGPKISTGTVYLPRHAASAIYISRCWMLSRNMTSRHYESHIENDCHRTKSNISVPAGRS